MSDKCCGRNIKLASRRQERELQRQRDKERSDACKRVGCRKMTEKSGSRAAGTQRHREGLPNGGARTSTSLTQARRLPLPERSPWSGATAAVPASRATSPRGGAKASTGEAPQPGLRRANGGSARPRLGTPHGSLTDGHLREEAGWGTARPAPRHALPPWVGNPSNVLTGWGPRTERQSVAADCREMR